MKCHTTPPAEPTGPSYLLPLHRQQSYIACRALTGIRHIKLLCDAAHSTRTGTRTLLSGLKGRCLTHRPYGHTGIKCCAGSAKAMCFSVRPVYHHISVLPLKARTRLAFVPGLLHLGLTLIAGVYYDFLLTTRQQYQQKDLNLQPVRAQIYSLLVLPLHRLLVYDVNLVNKYNIDKWRRWKLNPSTEPLSVARPDRHIGFVIWRISAFATLAMPVAPVFFLPCLIFNVRQSTINRLPHSISFVNSQF